MGIPIESELVPIDCESASCGAKRDFSILSNDSAISLRICCSNAFVMSAAIRLITCQWTVSGLSREVSRAKLKHTKQLGVPSYFLPTFWLGSARTVTALCVVCSTRRTLAAQLQSCCPEPHTEQGTRPRKHRGDPGRNNTSKTTVFKILHGPHGIFAIMYEMGVPIILCLLFYYFV